MIGVCKKISSFVPKVADVYAQLMQTNDGTELSALQNCLISLFHIDAKGEYVSDLNERAFCYFFEFCSKKNDVFIV